MTDTYSGATGHRIDRVTAAGAVLALLGLLALPFAVFRANRIVSGVGHAVWSAGPWGIALLVACLAALAGAAVPRGPLAHRVKLGAASAATIALGYALGSAAIALRAGQPDISRVSLGAGAWLAGAGIAVLWFAASHESGRAAERWVAGGVALAGVVGASLLGGLGGLSIVTEYRNEASTFWGLVGTHLGVAAASLGIALLIGVPLGIAAARVGWVRSLALGVTGVIETVPSLALLGLLVLPLAALGLPGIGPLPAVIALTLYALLPIVRNTYLGIAGVDPAAIDAGRGMGMSGAELLARVEVPLALPLFIEGVRAAAVLVIGISAVVAFIGVGTLGVLVFEGWGQQADDLILLGAVPMVVLAVAVDWALRVTGRLVVSPGIRRERA